MRIQDSSVGNVSMILVLRRNSLKAHSMILVVRIEVHIL